MKVLKILLYGDIDLNFMDGSAVWLVSLSKMLTQNKNIALDLLLKAPESKTHLVSSLKGIDNLNLIQPYSGKSLISIPEDRLDVSSAAKYMQVLDFEKQYHLIITRGQKLALELMKYKNFQSKLVPYATDFKHEKCKSTLEERKSLKKIYDYYNAMFLQTKETKEAFKKLIKVDGQKIQLLYPMIPNITSQPYFFNKRNRVVYAGKFHEDWHTEEILDSAQKFSFSQNQMKFFFVGDKFQDRLREKENQNRIKNKLNLLENIEWFGAVSRERAQEIIRNSDVGIAWRSSDLDNDESVELSCKLLEYGRLGKPTLIRRTKMHEEILGKDYPLFVDTQEEFEKKIIDVLQDRVLYEKSAQKIFSSVEFFTFENAYKRLHSFIWSYYKEKTKILFVGHDLKFAKLIIEYFNKHPDYECKIDEWESHTKHDERYSQECLEWADLIFCEWGLGNVEWYSKRKKDHQKLVVRLHFQEKDLMYLSKSKKENIDKYIVITPYMFEEFVRIFDLPKEKVVYIDNLVREEMFTAEKKAGSEFNLGIIGILPARKRLDLALDVFEKLWEKDRRYKLYVKGRLPQEVSWVIARKTEKEYYDQIMSRIYNAPWGNHVIFEKHGDDINVWLKKIGHLLSTSDYEGSHVSVSEAMSSATHPVIRNWKGSYTIYPKDYIHEDIESMVQAIETFEYNAVKKKELTDFAKNKFFAAHKNEEIKELFDALYGI